MEAMIDRVAERTGRRPKITYCLTDEFLSERLDEAFRFVEQGHEVGIHSHLPGAQRQRNHSYRGRYAYRLDERGVLNQDAIAGAFRQIAMALGLPAPQTHVSGMFTFQKTTIQVLQEAGFAVDCSLLPGQKSTHPATGDFVLCDNRRRPSAFPYRPAQDDPWSDGDSEVIELPVSGNLGGGDIDGQIAHLRERLDGAQDPDGARDLDVFQSFWHHFEFAELGWTKGTIPDAERFLVECARHDIVAFSTAGEAAAALRKTGL
jgi:hypothetical protein